MGSNSWEMNSRRASRKRRRLSERRRLFGRIGLSEHQLLSGGSQMSSSDGYDSYQTGGGGGGSGWSAIATASSSTPPRSDSPLGCLADGGGQKVSMKIQFHIAVAPQNEPLIVDTNCAAQYIQQQQQQLEQQQQQQQEPESPSISSINEQIQDKMRLSRQSSSSTKRRQQLLAMHNNSTNSSAGANCTPTHKERASLTSTGGTTTTTTTTTTEGSSSTDPGTPLSSSGGDGGGGGGGGSGDNLTPPSMLVEELAGGCGREPGARSSTISGGMADEATLRFLQADQRQTRRPQFNSALNLSAGPPPPLPLAATSMAAGSAGAQLGHEREHIYFKRDGQRFGHEFTLKLAVDRTYRCLLKVRPLMPLESISIQGHQVLFVDCSQQAEHHHQVNTRAGGGGGGSAPGSAASSTLALNHQQQQQQQHHHHQRLRSGSAVLAAGASPSSRHASQPVNDAYLNKHRHHNHHQHHLRNNHHNNSGSGGGGAYSSSNRNNTNHLRSHPISKPDSTGPTCLTGHRGQLHHAQTTASLYRPPPASSDASSKQLAAMLAADSCSLYRQQQNQMMRHFAASYCSTSNSHLGNQLIYMFDWPASRFEVNRNKNRTEIHTVLKFENGQIISLPLQVKFYPSDCRQHLEWGSQLHFIDYDCQLNQLGQVSVDRIQYY